MCEGYQWLGQRLPPHPTHKKQTSVSNGLGPSVFLECDGPSVGHRTMERLVYLCKPPCGSSHPGAQKQLPRVLSQQVVLSVPTQVPGPVQTAHSTLWELLPATGKPHSPSLGETEEMGEGVLERQQAHASGWNWGSGQRGQPQGYAWPEGGYKDVVL